MRKIFNFIKRLLSSAVAGTEVVNTVANVQQAEPSPVEEKKQVQEVAYFTRANNLIQEFKAAPTPIYSSNFNDPEPIGYMIDEVMYDRKGNKVRQEQSNEPEDAIFDSPEMKALKERLLTPDSKTYIMPESATDIIARAENERHEEKMEQRDIDERDRIRTLEMQKQAAEKFPEYNEYWQDKTEE